MSSYSRNIKLLQKLNGVDEECSDNEQGISDVEDTDSDKEIIIIREKEDEPTESGADGTVWQEINSGYQTGRTIEGQYVTFVNEIISIKTLYSGKNTYAVNVHSRGL